MAQRRMELLLPSANSRTLDATWKIHNWMTTVQLALPLMGMAKLKNSMAASPCQTALARGEPRPIGDDLIPEDLHDFILRHIASIAQLEALLFLRRSRRDLDGRGISEAAVYQRDRCHACARSSLRRRPQVQRKSLPLCRTVRRAAPDGRPSRRYIFAHSFK